MILITIFVSLILIWISWTDISSRTISNQAVLILLLALLPFCWFFYKQVFILSAIVTLIIGFLLFMGKIIGGGDVKLLTVLMLAIPYEQITSFLFLTSFFGLLLVIVGWIWFRQNIKQQGLPYGVAISVGFLANIWLYN
ncbi:A24 family peptidase [Phocoenobacter skyensis]|uniref:Prepilin peptidase n=1 Tax=Phocoenobacter skyensis TaxID=97481 RepID=A0A1H7X4Z6_9PAST|nr:prepilin peptidase [Pasteurella skyensis]MDP8079596.1 prepilin peptidase [Pasteurella skyensis]MDP8085545.1 prepilin peptidase [Pasteurella skyensis]MDP8185599.1 prepilin peptidase [Pasteurella skyensis]QLB21916.1 flp operon protein B [Pasteurella skyensis]SEM28731.1 prepilin peptidase CpaA [Pasteurella skyensis]